MNSSPLTTTTKDEVATTKCNAVNENKSEFGEFKDILTKMNSRIEMLEKENESN